MVGFLSLIYELSCSFMVVAEKKEPREREGMRERECFFLFFLIGWKEVGMDEIGERKERD